ncbi:hypothetical protein LPB142_04860 [Rhodobacter xanthinilyticus]|uniref:Uncharacterized protein n=1 Tax=Rhodobacter xanthinilyticus TaxID=1850250 RepID=A0A1D9MAA1_9RHOB|nr:hypothetical protein [Rhodobacter xanthinilyticus]AOZ68728.1 hypothetical protein LPB142_04860 [Rhodobacter xanthinilyticus]
MLQLDFRGRVIEPGYLSKTLGGDLDSRGIPDLWEIPTTGGYAGVTVSDPVDGTYLSQYMGKIMSRAAGSPGPIRVQGPVIRTTYGMGGIYTSAHVIGLGTTSMSFKMGLLSDDSQTGVYVEHSGSQAYLTRVTGGVVTRQAIALDLNGNVDHAQIGIWVTRNQRPEPNDWTVTLEVNGGLREQLSGDRNYMSIASVRPVVEWVYSGTNAVSRTICNHIAKIYWQN